MPRELAGEEYGLLRERLARLRALKRLIGQSTDGAEQIRDDAVQVAIEHVQAAIDALEVASSP
jgi:hypothetical protein